MPTVNDDFLTYLQDNSATSSNLPSAQKEFLEGQGVDFKPLDNMWMEYLGSLGYAGTLRDRWYKYLRNEGYTGTFPDMFLQFSRLHSLTLNTFITSGGDTFITSDGDTFMVR